MHIYVTFISDVTCDYTHVFSGLCKTFILVVFILAFSLVTLKIPLILYSLSFLQDSEKHTKKKECELSLYSCGRNVQIRYFSFTCL